jgi:hypothetical protein
MSTKEFVISSDALDIAVFHPFAAAKFDRRQARQIHPNVGSHVVSGDVRHDRYKAIHSSPT